MTQRIRDILRRPSSVALALGLAALALYVRTAARTVVFGDGPELATAAYQLGVCHPTGYPLYILLCHLAIKAFPIGEVIFRTTLVSAFFGAVAVALTYAVAWKATRRRWIALFVGALFAVTDTFWSQAVITEVYTLHMVLSLLVLLLVLCWDRSGDRRTLRWASAAFGLGLAHHLMIVLWLPASLFIVATSRHRPSVRCIASRLLPLALLPLLLYIYLPLAAARDPMMNWGDVRTVRNFVGHVTGAQYRFKMGKLGWRGIRARIANYGGLPEEHVRDGYLLSQFNLAIIWLAPVGWFALFRRRRRVLVATLLAYLLPVVWGVVYDIPDPDAYYLPSHVIVALWIGLGLGEGVTRLRRGLRRLRLKWPERRRLGLLACYGGMVFPLLVGAANFSLNDLSGQRAMRGLGREALRAVEPNAILHVGGDDWAFCVVYAQQVDGIRPDVIVLLDTFYQGATWRLIQRESRRGLVVVEPECSARVPVSRKDEHGWCRIIEVINRNYRRRPFYLAGPGADKIDKSVVTKRRLPPYHYLVSKTPMIRFDAAAPRPQGSDLQRAPVRSHR